MRAYLEVMKDILENGVVKADRTGTGTRSVFGRQMRFPILGDGFPLVTTKKTHMKSITYELLWFLQGASNKNWLNDHGVSIWDAWADEDGYLGPIYGYQWRSWPNAVSALQPHDQICTIINQLKTNPDDRRMIVSAWNVDMIDDMRLPPCHLLFQFWTHELSVYQRLLWAARQTTHVDPYSAAYDLLGTMKYEYGSEYITSVLDERGIPRRGLSCQLYQRSCDWFLGVPFNIASYSMLTMMIAQVVGMVPYEFVWTGGDCHLYRDHEDQARKQLSRLTKPLPWLCLNKDVTCIDDFVYEDFKLIGYESHPAIKAPISI